MLVKSKYRDVLFGDLWAGTHITINDQLAGGFDISKKLFWNLETGA